MEDIAMALLKMIADAEGIRLHPGSPGKVPDRKWILDTYAECAAAVASGAQKPRAKPIDAAAMKAAADRAASRLAR